MNTQYRWHKQGEDLGWSTNCHELGYQLYIAGHIFTPHIMSKTQFAEYRKQGGDPRKNVINGTRDID